MKLYTEMNRDSSRGAKGKDGTWQKVNYPFKFLKLIFISNSPIPCSIAHKGPLLVFILNLLL